MKECPRCHYIATEDEHFLNSLSRRVNETYICNDCSVEQGLIDDGLMPPTPFDLEFGTDIGKTGGLKMAIIEQEQIVEQPADVTQSEQLEENLRVTINEPFMLGLCFGLGFGAAVIFYGLIALGIVKIVLDELSRSW